MERWCILNVRAVHATMPPCHHATDTKLLRQESLINSWLGPRMFEDVDTELVDLVLPRECISLLISHL